MMITRCTLSLPGGLTAASGYSERVRGVSARALHRHPIQCEARHGTVSFPGQRPEAFY
jgi:hypothetical protein